MKNQKEQWVKNIEEREDALKLFKRNFKQNDAAFALAVKALCDKPDSDDEIEIRHVAGLLQSNKKYVPDRLQYLAVMTSELNLGRNKNAPHVLGGEGPSKLRAVLGIVCSTL